MSAPHVPDRRLNKSVLITGGHGFLGRAALRRLQASGFGNVIVPRSKVCARLTLDGIRQALADGRPQMVNHLATVVGGISACRENPGRFFYRNAIMGIQLMELRADEASGFVARTTLASRLRATVDRSQRSRQSASGR